MRALRDEVHGKRPVDPIRQALECLWAEIAGAARWARTKELETARAKHRRRNAGPSPVILDRETGRWIAAV
jgi:hypothetical protein